MAGQAHPLGAPKPMGLASVAAVPCGSCTLCCRGEEIYLFPEKGDKVSEYDAEPCFNPLSQRPGHKLKHKPGGDCIYLGPSGCTIHDRAPAMCKAYDCRAAYLILDRAERRRRERALPGAKALYARGRELLEAET